MATIYVHHKVKDYMQWRKAFDRIEPAASHAVSTAVDKAGF